MPITKKEEDMRGEGWKKELTIKRIVIRNGVVQCEEWDFFATSFPCSVREGGSTGAKCGDAHVWIKCVNGKLFKACWRHRMANGPISFESGRRAKVYNVGTDEALKICHDYGYKPPKELLEIYNDERASKLGIRRRPNE